MARAGAPSAERSFEPSPPNVSPSPLRFGTGVIGAIDTWSTPGAALAAGVYGEVRWRAPIRFARFGARRAAGGASLNDRSASFTTLAARLEGCPISFVLSPGFELPACVAVELGQLSGAGRASAALSNPASDRILWAALDGSVGLRWEPGSWWVLEARGAAGFPLIRHSFVFRGPDQPIFDVPVV